jgi:hypothetical protein
MGEEGSALGDGARSISRTRDDDEDEDEDDEEGASYGLGGRWQFWFCG